MPVNDVIDGIGGRVALWEIAYGVCECVRAVISLE